MDPENTAIPARLWSRCTKTWSVVADSFMWEQAALRLDRPGGLDDFIEFSDVFAAAWLARMWKIQPVAVGIPDPWDTTTDDQQSELDEGE